jgi:protein ImuB
MAIPSYDDLTPSIPDISAGEVFSAVATVLPRRHSHLRQGYGGQDGGQAEPRAPSPESHAGELYAALHDDAAAAVSAVERLMAIAREFSPRIERHRGGTVVLDVSGLQRLFGDAQSLADHLARAGAPQVAIARSRIAAVLLARAHRGVTVADGDPAVALRTVPLAVLQQMAEEIDADSEPAARRLRQARRAPRAFEVLHRWGLTTIGELAALPAAELSARLGAAGIAQQRLARGIDPRPLIPDPGVRRFVESFELEWPIDLLEPLSFVFARLLEPLATALEKADRGGVALHLQLRLTDRTTHARTLGLPAPMRDPRVLRTLLLLDLESHPPPAAVDVVTIEIDPAPGRIVQFSLLERPVPSPETLATLMARLGALVGEARCGSPQILDTHRPDGWTMTPVAFADSAFALQAAADKREEVRPNGPADLWRDTPSRVAGASRTALRRFRPPVAVRVAVEGGRPVRVAIDRRGMPGGVVRQAAGPWRTSGGWWDASRWNHDEWDVAFEDGAVCRIFQDRDDGGWFVEGVYD